MIEITSNPITPELVINSVKKDDYGAIVAFIGTARNTCKDGNRVTALEIKCNSIDAETKLHKMASEIRQKWQLQDIAICRRIGRLKVGEIALVVAVTSHHRQKAFQACEHIIDRIKQGKITMEKDIYAPG
jgi:molybdopterin synthase catalytic subunit